MSPRRYETTPACRRDLGCYLSDGHVGEHAYAGKTPAPVPVPEHEHEFAPVAVRCLHCGLSPAQVVDQSVIHAP